MSLVARVQLDVLVQVALLTETLLANFTLEWLVVTVDLEMFAQTSHFWEPFFADLAHKRAVGAVYFHVAFHDGFRGESSATYRAAERSISALAVSSVADTRLTWMRVRRRWLINDRFLCDNSCLRTHRWFRAAM